MADVPQKKNGNGDIRIMIQKYKDQFALALPKHLTADRFIRVALTALTKTPKLEQCTQESLMSCLLDCSALGIEPDGRRAHLIPYGNKCTLIIDYKGLVELVRRSGDVAYIHADVVHEDDQFEYSFGSEGKLIHKPNLEKKGKVIAAYSYIKMKDGSDSYEVMRVADIEDVRKRSKAGQSGPWVTDWNEMAKKTVFRRATKWFVQSPELQEVLDRDCDKFEPIKDITPQSTKPKITIEPEILTKLGSEVDKKPTAKEPNIIEEPLFGENASDHLPR